MASKASEITILRRHAPGGGAQSGRKPQHAATAQPQAKGQGAIAGRRSKPPAATASAPTAPRRWKEREAKTASPVALGAEAEASAAPAAASAADDAVDLGSARREDADPLTASMLQELVDTLRRRADRASKGVVDLAKERVHAPVAGLAGNSDPSQVGATPVLQDIIHVGDKAVRQAAQNEQQLAQILKEITDPEAIKNNAGLRKQLQQWSDENVIRMVTSAAESQELADEFVSCVEKGIADTSIASGSIANALRVNRSQLKDVFAADMRAWLTDGVAPGLKSSLAESTMTQARSTLEQAMRDVSAQNYEAVGGILNGARKGAGADEFRETCKKELAAAIRTQVAAWEEEVAKTSASPAPRRCREAAPSALGALFVEKLRIVSEPFRRDLDALEKDMALAAASISAARATADAMELSRRRGDGNAGAVADPRASVLEAVASGRTREAFETALAADARNPQAPSLTGVVCDQLSAEVASDEEAQPVNMLIRADGSEVLDMRLKCEMMVVLVDRAGREDAEFPRITSFLEWLLALLQLASGPLDAGGLYGLEGRGPAMISTLEALAAGTGPASVAQAQPQQKKHVISMARFALKGLRMLLGGAKRSVSV